MSSLSTQVGGDHYKSLPIQPVEYITKNGLGYIEGSVIKYVTRHKSKNGAEDIKKAIHFLNLLLELEYGDKKEGDQKTDRCKALFRGVDKSLHGALWANMSDHMGLQYGMRKYDLKAWLDHSVCPTCKAVASLAIAELAKAK